MEKKLLRRNHSGAKGRRLAQGERRAGQGWIELIWGPRKKKREKCGFRSFRVPAAWCAESVAIWGCQAPKSSERGGEPGDASSFPGEGRRRGGLGGGTPPEEGACGMRWGRGARSQLFPGAPALAHASAPAPPPSAGAREAHPPSFPRWRGARARPPSASFPRLSALPAES